jgi:hypothetical protein
VREEALVQKKKGKQFWRRQNSAVSTQSDSACALGLFLIESFRKNGYDQISYMIKTKNFLYYKLTIVVIVVVGGMGLEATFCYMMMMMMMMGTHWFAVNHGVLSPLQVPDHRERKGRGWKKGRKNGKEGRGREEEERKKGSEEITQRSLRRQS